MSYPGDHDRRKVNEGMWRPSRKVISAWGAWFLASPLGRLTVLAAFAIVPAVAASWGVSTPQERRIHIEAFRYGKRPAVIRCNRGDTLRLTFSARDTGHSFFLEEFDIDAKITPSRKEVAVYRVKDPTSPPQWTSEVQFEARYPGPFGWLISKSQYRCHVWCGPMHAFEHGNLIVYPNYLLWSGLGLVVGFLLLAWHDLMQNRPLPARRSLSSWNQAAGGRDIASHWLLESLLHNRCLQYLLILVCGMVFYLAVLAALGGTKVAGRNFGVIFTWVVWLFLLVMILVPLAGRVWCCVCPIPVLGELVTRGGRLRPYPSGADRMGNAGPHADTNWEETQLARNYGKRVFLRTLLLLGLGTISSWIVAVPRVTGILLLTLSLIATVIGATASIRVFCMYLCPVAAFLNLYARVAAAKITPASTDVCQRCRTHSCEHGNQRGWPCPFGTRIGEVHPRSECGWCLECFKSCPFKNVSLRVGRLAEGLIIREPVEIWQAAVLLVLGIAYCIVHLGPWPEVRDYTNLVDKFDPGRFATYGATLWFSAAILMPALVFLAGMAGAYLARSPGDSMAISRSLAAGLVPLGLAVWMGFVWQMFCVHGTFVLQVMSDPLGWGWDLFGTANLPWRQILPEWIPFVQVGLILAGFRYALRVSAEQLCREEPASGRFGLALLPSWGLLAGVTAGLVKFFAD